MTVGDIAELVQQLVKGGVVRGRDTLDIAYYENLVISARDFLLFSQTRDKNSELFSRIKVTSTPKDYEIKDGVVELEAGYNIQGLNGVAGLSKSKQVICSLMMPLSSGEEYLVCNNFFTYYIPTQSRITFVNKPNDVKYLRVHSIAGSNLDDEISNDLSFLIIQQVMKLGQMSEEKRKDDSADGNGFDDYMKGMIKSYINNPEKIV
jgi:hypothetical protein